MVLSDFVYFQMNVLEIRYFCRRFPAYYFKLNIPSDITHISPYENLVDYNVFQREKTNCGDLYDAIKYQLDDILEDYNNFRNPLRQCLYTLTFQTKMRRCISNKHYFFLLLIFWYLPASFLKFLLINLNLKNMSLLWVHKLTVERPIFNRLGVIPNSHGFSLM